MAQPCPLLVPVYTAGCGAITFPSCVIIIVNDKAFCLCLFISMYIAAIKFDALQNKQSY